MVGGIYDKIVPQALLPISMWVFFSFAQCVKIIQQVSGFLLEGIVPYVAVDLVCLGEEVSSRAFYVTISIWNSPDL